MSKQKYIRVKCGDNLPDWETILEQQKKWQKEHEEEIMYATAVRIREQYNKWQQIRAEHPNNTLDYWY